MNDQRITARELRIGNFVNRPNFGQYEITQIKQGYVQTNKGALPIMAIEAIPLTEQWLLMFGFTKHEGNVLKNINLPYWALDAVCLFFNGSPPENTYLIGIGFNVGSDCYAATTRWINTVHDLQNFYYQAKGTELTIKETAS